MSSVEAWFSTALDIEVLAQIGSDQLHVMVADAIKSFDAVDMSILDCSWSIGAACLVWEGVLRLSLSGSPHV